MSERTRLLLLAIAGALTFFFVAMHGSANKSATSDEFAHVAGGYSYWKFDDYRLQPENGNWAQRIDAIPQLVSGAAFPTLQQPAWEIADVFFLGEQFFFDGGRDADSMLRSSRRMVAIVGALLAVLVFFWSRRIFGTAGGVVSLAAYVFTPSILANGALATSDIIAAAFFIAATWALWVVVHRATPSTVAVSVVATGGLFLAKFSALVFIPMALTILAVRMAGSRPLLVGLAARPVAGRRRNAMFVGLTLVHVVGVVVLIWASFSWRYTAFNAGLTGRDRFIDPWSEVIDSSLVSRSVQWARRHEVLPEAYLFGLSTVLEYSKSRSAFLNGTVSRTGGWRWFFPYAALVKATIPSMLLLGIAIWSIGWTTVRHRSDSDPPLPDLYELVPVIVLIAWYWVFAITSHLNIGHRHLMPVSAATAVLLGAASLPITRGIRAFRLPAAERGSATFRRATAGAFVVVALLAWHAAEAARISPHFLAYFNLFAGGPSHGYRHLVDSSLDWGQDLPELKTWLDSEGLQKGTGPTVYLSYFGNSRLAYYGIQAEYLPSFPDRWPPRFPPPLTAGVYCVSATMLQAVYLPDAPGAWTTANEKRYQDVMYNLRLFDSTRVNPAARAALLKQTGEEFWTRNFRLFEQLRFARLAAFLRRREPDAQIGYSIMVYRLSDEDVASAVAGPVDSLSSPSRQ